MLDDPNVDAVEILTPHSLHAQMVVDALDAGKHVSLQKPMAITLAECNAIVEAANSSDKFMRVFENLPTTNPWFEQTDARRKSIIGEPISMRMKTIIGNRKYGWDIPDASMAWRFDQSINGVGKAILDYGYHIFAMGRWFLGEPNRFRMDPHILHRRGLGKRLPPPRLMVLRRRQDTRLMGTASQQRNGRPLRLLPGDEWFELSGTRGVIWVNRCTCQDALRHPALTYYADGEMHRVTEDEINADWGNSFVRCVNEFVTSILENRQPDMTAEDSRETYKFARASQLAAR